MSLLGNRRNTWRRRIASKPVLVIMLIIVFLLSNAVISVYKKNIQANVKADEVLGRKDILQKDFDALKKESDSMGTSFGIETELRKKFDVAKDGEELFVIVDVEKKLKPIIKKKSWMDNVKSFFGI